MRNRVNTPAKDENSFINGGTAGVDRTSDAQPILKVHASKTKPVSISFADENLRAIDEVIRDEMLAGRKRVNRSDVVRAAVLALENLSKSERSVLLERSKLK